jgi:signal transduction histidine kinase
VVKHARARTVRLTLGPDPGGVRLVVIDDGTGFDAAAVQAGHLGLAGMKARAEAIGGQLGVETRPGKGTTIAVVVPRAGAAEP